MTYQKESAAKSFMERLEEFKREHGAIDFDVDEFLMGIRSKDPGRDVHFPETARMWEEDNEEEETAEPP